jgi:hypothetical protein
MNSFSIYLLLGYFAFFLVTAFGVALWLKSRRRPKSPFKANTRLLRSPGESLREEIQKMDDALPEQLLLAMVLPLVAAVAVTLPLLKFKVLTTNTFVPVFFAVLGIATFISAWRLIKKALKRSDYNLGYFGERVVAEALEPLRAEGWRIFHDVPAQVGKMKFNVDHVAIGPSGIFGIETKSRRKGHARPGRKDYEVFYDGKMLSWPWTDEMPAHGVQNALDRAKWLEDWLVTATGETIRVNPVLTFPEWYVKETGVDPRLRVVATSWLPSVLKARTGVLTAKQIDLLARQVDQRCRNVEY